MSGFQHQKRYMIQNLIHGNFMDLSNSSTVSGNSVIGFKINGRNNQHWIAVQQGEGFRLTSALDEKKALDQGPDNAVIYWDFHGGPNQLWISYPLFNNRFLILNCRDKNAIRNQAPGAGLKCRPADKDDEWQHWVITEV